MKKPTKGFTLSEVLITLAIVGVVAALTIPTLINNYQKQQYMVSLKKAYSTFNQVLQQISADKGCINDLACTGLFATGTSDQSLGDELVKYFKVTKNCGVVPDQGCFAQETPRNYDGTSTIDNYDSDAKYKFIIADGTSFYISNSAANCSDDYSTGRLGNMAQTCGSILIDVNGPTKGPNDFGRDTFKFFITNGKGALLYPRGGMDDKSGGSDNWWNGVTKSCYSGYKYGPPCAGRVAEEDWKMNY